MAENKKYHISGLLKVTMAVVIAGAILVLSASAVGNKDKERINNVNINIIKTGGQLFISPDEISSVLNKAAGKSLKNQPVGSLDLSLLENKLMKLKWVKHAELFIDNRNVLQVKVEQHTPVARVFSSNTNSFFVSGDKTLLPFRNSVSTRLPVFTGFAADVDHLKHDDSVLIDGIANIASFIDNDNFWMAQIDQIDITPAGKFEMVPKLGNQIIRFGDAEDYQIKFSKLLAFYQQVANRTGWDKYSAIDLQFSNQVVAERRDAAQVKSDSIATLKIMKAIIADARKAEIDDSSRIQLPDKPSGDKARINTPPDETFSEPVSEVIPEKPGRPVSPVAPLSNDKVERIPETAAESSGSSKKEKNTGEVKKIPKAVMPSSKKENE